MRWFFILLPWMELFTLIQLGSRIGAVETMLYVLATFFLGLAILRAQGMEIVNKLRAAQSGAAVIPQQLLGDELALGLAGLLLIVPGLITDFLAIIVLLGPLRRRIFTALGGKTHTATYQSRQTEQMRPGEPIEGEFRRLDDEDT
ncbi:FxsA family protein [Congregibacter variabilis]|uniref:FxsA family protein n=1 Tax=Congregibacter variabilis TaxID=3081200 RepID=A0ABZ0I2P0_9GAMM|nr:FxsA family protein [Congregibacter sp. IMCC43200]